MLPLKTKPEPDADARITRAACAVDDTVYVGWRHDVIIVEHLKPLGLATQWTSGFVDQHGFFWDRETSARIALAAEQTSVLHEVLVSEALWDADGRPRSPSEPYDPLGDRKPVAPQADLLPTLTSYQMAEVLRECVRNNPQAVRIADRLCSALITVREAQIPGRVAVPSPAASAEPHDEAELRRLWTEAGGSFHGPNVEHGSMPEAKLLPFLGALIRERDDAFAEAKAQQDRRFEALRERDIAKASAQTACEQLTQQMARSDELAVKLDDTIARICEQTRTATQGLQARAETAERDAAEAKGTAIGLHRIARDADSRAATLTDALRAIKPGECLRSGGNQLPKDGCDCRPCSNARVIAVALAASKACTNCNGDRWIPAGSEHGMGGPAGEGVGYPCAVCNADGKLTFKEAKT